MRGGPGYVLFRDGTRQAFDQPLNTLDPRYGHCAEHRTGCICREAEWSEEVIEYRAEWHALRKAITEVLAGHDPEVCHCAGCEIAMRLHLTHLTLLRQPKARKPDQFEEVPF